MCAIMNADERLELCEAGVAAVRPPNEASEMAIVAGEVIIGFGIIVRLPPPCLPLPFLCAYLPHLLRIALMACLVFPVRQARVKNCRGNIPDHLTLDMLDLGEVPVVVACSHPNVMYYGNISNITPEAKALWSSLDKDALPDPLFAHLSIHIRHFPRCHGSF